MQRQILEHRVERITSSDAMLIAATFGMHRTAPDHEVAQGQIYFAGPTIMYNASIYAANNVDSRLIHKRERSRSISVCKAQQIRLVATRLVAFRTAHSIL